MLLSIKTGASAGNAVEIKLGQVLTIGRNKESDLCCDDNFMSGIHFEVENCGEFAIVRDRNSRNKTWVNNIAISNQKLTSTDSIRAGRTLFALVHDFATIDFSEKPMVKDVLDSMQPIPSEYAEVVSKPSDSPELLRPNYDLNPSEIVDTNKSSLFMLHQSNAAQADDPESRIFHDSVAPVDGSLSHLSILPISHPHRDVSSDTVMQLELTGNDGIASWVASTIERLNRSKKVLVVAHFKKIGMLWPSGLIPNPVFSDLLDMQSMLPAAVDGDEWMAKVDHFTMDRLGNHDGLILVVCNSSTNAISGIQRLAKQGVEGFSEKNGFLGWCWPSQFDAICLSQTPQDILKMLGSEIEGVMYPVNNNVQLKKAWVTRSLAETLLGLGYVVTQH